VDRISLLKIAILKGYYWLSQQIVRLIVTSYHEKEENNQSYFEFIEKIPEILGLFDIAAFKKRCLRPKENVGQ
jgi:hypothetical protein